MFRAFQFLLIVLMLALLAMLAAVTTMHFAIHGAEVTVPSFKGLTVAEATDKAAALGLNLKVDSHFYSVDIPVGHVLSQSPAAGTVVRREWHVRLTESLGPQRVAIPDLTGSDQRLASIQIRRVGLELGDTADMPYAYASPGTVIAQNPAPDAAGVERPSVGLLIAAPPLEANGGMVMPDFTGQVFSSAALVITRAGLKLAPVKTAQVTVPDVASTTSAQLPQPILPIGTVTGQSPPPGHRVDASTPIELTVAQ
ncbi:MAG TPA: PASTA domain-containing protein [Silvibacterium sp.]|nr:PASTA domain-containing protein [Silvibacterium sp.]